MTMTNKELLNFFRTVREKGNLKYLGTEFDFGHVSPYEKYILGSDRLAKLDLNLYFDFLDQCPNEISLKTFTKYLVNTDSSFYEKKLHLWKKFISNENETEKLILSDDLPEEIYKLAVEYNKTYLANIPEKYRTKEICELSLYNTPDQVILDIVLKSLQDTLNKEETFQLCKNSLNINGLNIKHVPEEYKTNIELLTLAVKNKGTVIEKFVPEELITKELCELALETFSTTDIIQSFPEQYRTYEMYKLAMKNNSFPLNEIPKKHKTKEMYEIAVRSKGRNIKYVPIEYTSKEMYIDSLHSSHGFSIKYIPFSEELYTLAIEINKYIVNYIPRKFFDKFPNLYDVIFQNGLIGNFEVPEFLESQEFYNDIVQKKKYTLEFVPEKYRTKELCELAFSTNEHSLQSVPDKLRTIEFCEKFGLADKFVATMGVLEYKVVNMHTNKVHKENYECPVMLKSSDDNMYIELSCKHLFCEKVIKGLKDKLVCPMCRSQIKQKIVKI
jgi:hypothetical protein